MFRSIVSYVSFIIALSLQGDVPGAFQTFANNSRCSLSKLQKTFEANARHRGMLFKRPSFYASNFTAGPSQSNAPPTLDPLFSLSAKFPPWIWSACNNALHSLERDPENGIRFSTASRQACLNFALKQLPTYPPRPSVTLHSSPTLERLRSLLAEAPSRNSPKGKDGYPQGLWLDETDHIDGETFWEWTKSYTDRIFGALIALIEERGVGEDGWESARWEVYDKVRFSCLSGRCQNLLCSRRRWPS